MEKLFKKGWLVGAGFLLSLLMARPVFAENQLSDITIEVELQEDGTGVITEQRQTVMDDGTELFIVLEEMQDSELLDFSVAGFEEVAEWDSGDSREEKAGKYGVIDTGDGQELVWGIGEYGENNYELTYSLSNLVRELEDGQALLWNFDTFSDIPAKNLTVEITGPVPFTEENTRLWGFGFDGDMQLVDGRVVWEAFEEVDSGNDVTVLLQFPPGTFQTQASVDMTLEEQQEMAMEGSTYNDASSSDDAIAMVIVLGAVVLGGGAAAGAVAYSVKVKNAKQEAGQMMTGAKRIQANEDIIFEDIPFQDDDLAGVAYLLHEMTKGYFEDFFSAYLIKWANEERVRIVVSENDSMFGEDYDTVIEIVHYEEERQRYNETFEEFVDNLVSGTGGTYATGLWIMLLDAADKTGLITDDRMKRWAKKHADKMEEYADYLVEYSKDYLERNGLVRFDEIEVWGSKHEVAVASSEGEELFDRLIQFDNYLEEIEIEGFEEETMRITFDEFLVWSILYFRSTEITEQFDKLIPEPDYYYEEGPYLHYYWYWHGMTSFRQNWSSGLQSGGFHGDTSSGAAGGMGGSTSFGGGMGAGGGGGGGAR